MEDILTIAIHMDIAIVLCRCYCNSIVIVFRNVYLLNALHLHNGWRDPIGGSRIKTIKMLQSWTKVVETHDNDQPFFPWCEFSPLPS